MINQQCRAIQRLTNVGHTPDKYVQQATAQEMAVKAYERATVLTARGEGKKDQHCFGIGMDSHRLTRLTQLYSVHSGDSYKPGSKRIASCLSL